MNARRVRARGPRLRATGLRARQASEHGAVTAETAMVLPLLLVLTLALVWVLSLALAQVRTVDAAREAARALARDEAPAEAVRLARVAAPEGAEVSVTDQGESVRVRVRAQVSGPGGVWDALPGVEVSHEAVSAKELR